MVRREGIRLVPTAANHKLGLNEVQSQIVKDESRSVVCGIQERCGYTFPKEYCPNLVGGICGLLNRTCRGDAPLSPYQMIFNEKRGLDVRRDLQVSIGEVLLSTESTSIQGRTVSGDSHKKHDVIPPAPPVHARRDRFHAIRVC
jgi:hypothetical protein